MIHFPECKNFVYLNDKNLISVNFRTTPRVCAYCELILFLVEILKFYFSLKTKLWYSQILPYNKVWHEALVIFKLPLA